MRRTLVLGIGSPIMSDDAVGLRVASQIRALGLEGVEVEELGASGLELIEVMMDRERVIVVDSIVSGTMPPGEVAILTPEDFREVVEGGSPHEVNIATAIELGKRLEPERMPREIYFVAVEVIDVRTVSEEMTEEVHSALPTIVRKVVELIEATDR